MNLEEESEDAETVPEETLPLWMKAMFIVVGIPLVNCIVPGSVVALATFIGLPDPKHREPQYDIAVPLPQKY